MAAQLNDIRAWFDRGAAKDNTAFMIVWCDTYDYDDYPAYYASKEEAQEALDKSGQNMQKAMECYDLFQPRDAQMSLSRCWALTIGGGGRVRDVGLQNKIIAQ